LVETVFLDRMQVKKRIAFLGGGVLVIPNTVALLDELSKHHEIIIYSEFHIDVTPNNSYKVKVIPNTKIYRKFWNVFFAWMVFKDNLHHSFDIIHAHSTFPAGFWGIIIGKIFRIPVIVSLDAGEVAAIPDINFGDLLNPKRARVNKWVLKHADEVIVPSQFHLQELRKNLNTNRLVQVIIRGVDIHKFKFIEKEIAKSLIILNVAYLHPIKDQETLLKCFAIINKQIDCELIHIGKDYNNGRIQQLTKEMGIADKVIFKGFIANDDLPSYYAQVDLLLHTSRFEGQAVVINEAMACGILVCGTQVGLMADLSDECCLTVKPQDAEDLAMKVLKLLKNEEEIKRLRNNAYKWTLENNLEQTVEKHIQLYSSITETDKSNG
jgi:glycosyltransferase involved in cell wall biosynthesis